MPRIFFYFYPWWDKADGLLDINNFVFNSIFPHQTERMARPYVTFQNDDLIPLGFIKVLSSLDEQWLLTEKLKTSNLIWSCSHSETFDQHQKQAIQIWILLYSIVNLYCPHGVNIIFCLQAWDVTMLVLITRYKKGCQD